MGKASGKHDVRMRQMLIQECARIMAEEGINDFLAAKRKAAQRLGAPDTRNLPTNREIQDALQLYQDMFLGESHHAHLRHLRKVALEAMRFFADFQPRLAGSVLSGTAGPASDINLHVFTDTPEDVAIFLMDRQIPFEENERRYRFGNDDITLVPSYRFVADDATVDLSVFSLAGLREAPRSQVDGKPMKRAKLGAVEALVEDARTSCA